MIRRLLARRSIRVLLWIFITLVTLLVLALAWINWSGNRRWAAAQDRLRQAGETLDFQALLPETPPERQNLLAIGPLDGLAAVVDHDAGKGAPAAKRQALEALRLPAEKRPAQEAVALGRAADFPEWIRYLQASKFLGLPSTPPPEPEAVLAALDARFPVLQQMADAVASRPQAAFTPGMRERERPAMIFAMPLPHCGAAQDLARALALRAQAALAARDSGEAARSLVALTRLAHACRQEGLLLGFLIGTSAEMMAVDPLWQGLRDHAFTEDDLRLLQSTYAADETTQPLLRALRTELAAGINALDAMEASPSKETGGNIEDLWGETTGRLLRRIPKGVYGHWKSAMAEMELQSLIQPLQGGLAAAEQAAESALEEVRRTSNAWLHPDRILVNLMMPSVSMILPSALMVETRRRQAFTAIALERFFLKHGKFPAKPEELVPEFLPQGMPLDPCDERPLRYAAPAAQGRYFRLWSVGLDKMDDGGRVTLDAQGHAKLHKRGYRGDWAWQYEPVK